MRAWRTIINDPRHLHTSATIFDVDGVLVDSTDRFRKAFREAGVTEEEFRKGARAKKKVWKAFLSEKYLELDKPVESAIKSPRRRGRKGVPVAIITGRRETLAGATVKELERFGVPWDVAVFINGKRVSIDVGTPALGRVVARTGSAKRCRLEYMGRSFEFADTSKTLNAVDLIRREVLDAYGFGHAPLEHVLSTAGRRHNVAIIDEKEVRNATLYSVNFGRLFVRIGKLAQGREEEWEGSST